METTENNKGQVVKKPRRRALKIVLGALAIIILVLIIGVLFAVPAYVSSDSGRHFILAKANASGAGALDFANLSMSWGKGISISKLSFKDKGEGVSVAVKGFSTKPHYGALLAGNLSFGETVIDEPKVEINVDKMKKEAEEKKKKAEGGEQKAEGGVGLPIGRIDLVVKDGDVKITGEQGKAEISQINSKVNLRPEGEQSNFEVGAKVGGGNNKESSISAKGEVTPGKGWGLKGTNGQVEIEVNGLDLSSLESILAIAGVAVDAKGVLSANVKAEIKDGMVENVSGDVKGSGLEVTAPQLKGDRIKTSILDAQVRVHKDGELMNVEKLTAATDWLKVEASGITPMSAATLEDFFKPDSKYELKANLECDIPMIASQLRNTAGLKEGMNLTRGKLTGSVQTLTEAGVKKLSGQLSVDGLGGTIDNKPVSISEPIRAQAMITAEGKQIKFENTGIKSSFANMIFTGTPESFSYDAQADLGKLAAELGQFADLTRYKLAGQATGNGKITNNESTTIVISTSSISNLKVSPTADITIDEPSAIVDISAALDKKTDMLLIKQFGINASLGQFSVKDGRVPIGKTKDSMELTASARKVDLAKIQPYLVMTKAISKDVKLGGIAESDITVSLKNENLRVTTETTKISNLFVQAPGKKPFTQDPITFALDAELNTTTKSWKVSKAEITSPNIKIKGTAEQKIEGQNTQIQGNAQLDYDWQSLSGMLSAFMPEGLSIEGKRKDAIIFSSRFPTKDSNTMMANLNASAKVGFDKADYMGLHLGATNVDIKVDKGLLAIAPFTTVVNSGQLNFGGSADFKQKPAFFRTPGPMRIIKDVQINDEIANKLLNKINPIFANSSRVSGLANFDCNQLSMPITGGTLDQANIAGTISLTQVRMQSGLLSTIVTATGGSRDNILMVHPTPFTVNQGYVRYQNMQMDLGTLPIVFGGIVPLDSNRQIENLSITLPISGLGKIIRSDSQTQPGRGSTLYIKGTPAKPELDLGKTLLEQAGKTGLEMLLEQAGKRK